MRLDVRFPLGPQRLDGGGRSQRLSRPPVRLRNPAMLLERWFIYVKSANSSAARA